MIAFDTCVLVRFLADDDPVQAEMAETLMREKIVARGRLANCYTLSI